MSPKDCAYIVERLAIRFMAMVADHERQLAEHRTSFGARTEADAKIIAGLRAEIKQRAKEQDQDHKTIVSLISERDGLRVQVQDMREEIIRVNEAHGRTKVVHDGLRDELTAQRDAFTAEVERIRRELHEGRDAEATVKLTPKVGDTVRLVTHPERARVAEHLRTALKWPWIDRWGVVGQTGKVVKPRDAVALTVAVALDDDSTVFARWPIDCLEVVAEATHDTEAGKAVAESALKTEPVAEEIKVDDLVEVVSATHRIYTEHEDLGRRGIVTAVDGMRLSVEAVPGYRLPIRGIVGKCDVRKVTT